MVLLESQIQIQAGGQALCCISERLRRRLWCRKECRPLWETEEVNSLKKVLGAASASVKESRQASYTGESDLTNKFVNRQAARVSITELAAECS